MNQNVPIFGGFVYGVFMDTCYLAVAEGYELTPPGNSQHYSATATAYVEKYPNIPWEKLRDEALALPDGEAFRRYEEARKR